MTASTLSNLPLVAGSAIASTLGRAGAWTFARYMRAPLASTGLMAMVTMTALAGSNALYFQTQRHPAPFFATPSDVPMPVALPAQIRLPAYISEPAAPAATPAPVLQDTTGSVPAPAPQVIPDQPVGNRQAFDVQKKLSELGLFDGKVDGFYGPRTAAAIRTFEERNGLTPTGALTPGVVEAILNSDAAGRAPVAQAPVVPQPAPVVQQAAIQPAPVPQPAPPQDRVVERLPSITPIDAAVDTVGDAAASTIDSIVAAVGGARSMPPVPQATALVPPVAVFASASQPMPAPVQVASLEPMSVPRADAAPAVNQQMAATSPALEPTNNVQLVSQIQRGLASLGFYHGTIDGHPGDATARAIREFENFHSYRVTGQIKPDLVGLLRDAGASV